VAAEAAGARAPVKSSRLRAVLFNICVVLIWIVGVEIVLRVADFRDLRAVPEHRRLPQDHDPELGWFHIPNKVTSQGNRINSMGLRDIEVAPTTKPTMLFIGDSFVYGVGVSDGERFTDVMREKLPDFRIVNAGVAAFGTDQQYLLLRRLWPQLQPRVVVLIVCVENDHEDNSSSARHGHTFKPYLVNEGGEWKFKNIPVPRSYRWYFYNNWWAENFMVVRLAVHAYHHIFYPKVIVPDPTSQLVGMMRDFVESQGARFLVGLQYQDNGLEPYLIAQNIPYTRLGDAELIPGDNHWNAQGHMTVARRLMALLTAEKVVKPPAP
jgi:hypothetical protein